MSPRRLGQLLKALREKQGMTQAQLAKRAKVSQGYIAKLEPSARPGKKKKTHHASNPSLDILQKLANALGVPVTELLE